MGECPLIHYTVNKELIIHKHQFSSPQSCNRSFIRNKRNYQSLLMLKYLQIRIAQFCDDDEKEGQRILDEYEILFGIQSQSSESSQETISDFGDYSKRIINSEVSEKSHRISPCPQQERISSNQNPLGNQGYTNDDNNLLEKSNKQYFLNDGTSINNFKLNDISTGNSKTLNGIVGSACKISQKLIQSDNELDDSDLTRMIKIAGENLLYGSDLGVGNTHTQYVKSQKTLDDKGQYSYQLTGSQITKQKSKLNNNNNNNAVQFSIGSVGSLQFMNGVSTLTEDQILDERQRKHVKSLSKARKSIIGSKQLIGGNSENDLHQNNEMKLIESQEIDAIMMQFCIIEENLCKKILDLQLNPQLSEEQKMYSLHKINRILVLLKNINRYEKDNSEFNKVENNSKYSIDQTIQPNIAQNIQKDFQHIFSRKTNEKQEILNDQNMSKQYMSQENKMKKQNDSKIFSYKIVNNDEDNILPPELDDVKKSYVQYFSHNNSEKVILIANMSLQDRKKKMNKIVVNRKMNKVEKKGVNYQTQNNPTYSKFSKLFNSFQNQSEDEDGQEINDNVSIKSNRKQSLIKRKLSIFGKQVQKNEESYKSGSIINLGENQYNNNGSQKSNKNSANDINYQNDLKSEKQSSPSLIQNKDINSSINRRDVEEGKNESDLDLNPTLSSNFLQNNIYQADLNEKANEKQENLKTNDSKQKSNLYVFQRTIGKKKLSEIPENECCSGILSSIDVKSQQIVGYSKKNQNSANINQELSDHSLDNQYNNLHEENRQPSISLLLSNKRLSNFFNQEALSMTDDAYTQYNKQFDGQERQAEDRKNNLLDLRKEQNKYNEDKRLFLIESELRNYQFRLQQQFDNNDKWLVNQGKDDGINPIYNMNITLSEVKKYHKWESQDQIIIENRKSKQF